MNNKRAKIIATAIKLFSSKGISVATAKIAKASGISNGTLFNYFPSKQNLIDEVYLSIKTEIATCILSETSEVKNLKKFLFCLWNSYIFWAIANPVKYDVVHLLKSSLAVSPDAINKTEEIFKVANQKISKGIEDQQIININLDYYCELVVSQLMAAVTYCKSQKFTGKNLENHINQSFNIYWNGIVRK